MRAPLIGALVVAALVITSCTESDDGAADAASSTSSTSVESAPTTEPAGPATSHVLYVALDDLADSSLTDPAGDMLALLGDVGRRGAVASPPRPAEGPCTQAWLDALRAGGAPEGDHLFDALADDGDIAAGLFTTSQPVADALTPESEAATVTVGAPDVPGLEPWPSARLAVDEVRTEAIRAIAEAEGDSVTVVQTDLLRLAAESPDAAEVSPIALRTVDDLVDLLIGSADARPDRRNERWLTIVSGGCADGTAPLVMEGDGIAQPAPIDLADAGHAGIGAIIAAYLGGEVPEGWPEAPADLLSEEDE